MITKLLFLLLSLHTAMIVTKHQNRLPRRLLSLRYACAHLTDAHLLSPVVVCFSKKSSSTLSTLALLTAR